MVRRDARDEIFPHQYLESLCLDVSVCHIQILCDNDIGDFAVIEFVAGARLVPEEGLPRSGVFERGK